MADAGEHVEPAHDAAADGGASTAAGGSAVSADMGTPLRCMRSGS